MKTLYDVQQLLKRFGIFIYTGHRLADLELMEEEVRSLYESGMMDPQDYKMALLVIKSNMQIYS
ncbi:YqgQ family protein [Fictibacillus enclensis]|uniref:YqgQ family protein n=1 Tax=Fictibacillus enclensis TaxID=1017270 RepID=UPI0025A1BD40|nr:YqgQ family protein [Fictibacillus enclensis]MDM5338940.1 YqgQ family protein [Fictibacillus enclensis]